MVFNFKKDKKTTPEQVTIALPEESYGLLEWKDEGMPCIAMLNSGLKGFEHKEIFSWYLSVIIDFEDIIENGMPSIEEREIVDPFCEQLEEDIKAGGNALFLVRETWNKTRRLAWQVYDPKIADSHLKYIVDYHRHPRPFDWHMAQDFEWKQAQWYLDQIT